MMTGYIYKEWKQNKRKIILMPVIAAAAVFLPVVIILAFPALGNGMKGMAADVYNIRLICLVIACFAGGIIQDVTLKDDNRRLWAMFSRINPMGAEEYVRVKYETVIGMALLMYGAFVSLSALMHTIIYLASGYDMTSYAEDVSLIMLFVQVLFRSIEIPLFYKMGLKKTFIIKGVSLAVVGGVAAAVYFLGLFGVSELFEGESSGGNAGQILSDLLCIGAAVGCYYSYKLSCGIFAKGAENYE